MAEAYLFLLLESSICLWAACVHQNGDVGCLGDLQDLLPLVVALHLMVDDLALPVRELLHGPIESWQLLNALA